MTINDILNKVLSTSSKSTNERKLTKEFIEEYSQKDISDVDWLVFCRDMEKYRCYKLGFLFIRKLLQQGLYSGSYADELYEKLKFYNEIGNQRTTSLLDIMCGENIKRQIIFQNHGSNKSQWYAFAYINTENRFVLQIFEEYLNSGRSVSRWCSRAIIEVFEDSLGKYRNAIHSVEDFTSQTMFAQCEFYKKHFAEDDHNRGQGLCVIVNFYRWLVRAYPEHNFFENTFDMSEKLLFNNRLSELIDRDFYFVTLNPTNIPYEKERVCFLLRGLDNESTRIVNDDYVSIDFSHLKSTFYRDLAIEFIATSTSASAIKWVGIPAYICDAMQALYEVKQIKKYPNKKLNYLTNQEAVFIRQYFDAQDIGIRTKNNKIGVIRRFLSFCVDKKVIQTDDLFFDYLIQYEEPNKNTAQTVSDSILVALNKALSEKGKDNLFYKEMFVIFHLAIQTEFRINQICHLKIDCIKPTVKPNQFMVQTNSKTSHGRKNNYVISTLTYHLLMDIIEETEAIREECCIDSLKDYIFIYHRRGTKKPVVFDDKIFTLNLKKICDEIGVPQCTASNLRDTHMTKSLEHIIRNGKSDLEMSVLSKHKHMDTTKNHYIEMELEKMLESTYGITIGTELIETDSKIVDDIPEYLAGEENDVENGCGKCTAETCVMTNALPCMACKHFITTIKHEVFFKKAIESVNRLIENTKNRHDKEDLVTIKELYVLYLKEIIKHKEGIANDN